MTNPPEDLRQLVQSRLDELGVTAKQAARESDGGASYEMLYRILSRRHSGRLREQTVPGLARALRVPESRVRAAAALTEPSEWVPPAAAHTLTARQRRMHEELIGVMAAGNERVRELEAEVRRLEAEMQRLTEQAANEKAAGR